MGINTQLVSFRLPQDLHDRLAEEAASEERNVSYIIRTACKAYLDAKDVLAGKGEENAWQK